MVTLREEIEAVYVETKQAYDAFVNLEEKRKNLLNRYYSDKYGIEIGKDEVYQVDSNKKIIVYGFFQGGEIDDKPEVIGKLKLPFGVAKKVKTFSSRYWETEQERRGEKNGNIKNDDFCDVNGNF